MILIRILKNIFLYIFKPRPRQSVFDVEKNYLKILNEFINRIFYDNLFKYVYNKHPEYSELLKLEYSAGNYLEFLSVFQRTNEKSKKIAKMFYKETVSEVLVKMSSDVRLCFYRIYSGNTLPELELKVKPAIESDEYSLIKRKKKFLEFIKKTVNFKFIKDKIETELNSYDYLNDYYEVMIDAINETEPGLNDYIIKFINSKIQFLSIEAEMLEEELKNEISYDISEDAKESELISARETNLEKIKKIVNYELFVKRMIAINMGYDENIKNPKN